MTHQDFINKHNNKKIERVDASNLNQCFDLVVAYAEDVLGLPRNIFAGNLHAYQIFENPTDLASQNFDFIKNTPYALPKKGDILVFKYGVSGHVVIVEEADINSFRAFSQNDPVGSSCVMKTYSYTNVIGWLRKITNSVAGHELQACLTLHKQAVDSANQKDKKIEQLENKLYDMKETEKRLKKEKDLAVQQGEEKLKRELAEMKAKCRQQTIDEILALIHNLR